MSSPSAPPSPGFPGSWRWADRGASALLVLWCVQIAVRLAITGAPPTDFDDAYFYIRYADNVLAGHGLVWNRGEEPVWGLTSLPYLGAVLVGRVLAPELDPASLLTRTSMAFGLAGALILALACRSSASSEALRRPFLPAVVVTTLVFHSESYLWHCIRGMDTTLAVAWNALLIAATLRWVRRRRGTFTVVLAAWGAYAVRPEQLVFGLTVPVLAAVLLVEDVIHRRRMVCHFVLWTATALSLDAAAKLAYFDQIVPLSFFAKASRGYAAYASLEAWNPMEYLFVFLGASLPFWIVLLSYANRGSARFLLVFLGPAIAMVLYLFSVLQIMGFEARYYLPILPFVVVSAWIALDRAKPGHARARSRTRGWPLGRVALAILPVFLVISVPSKRAATQAYERIFLVSGGPADPGEGWASPAGLPSRLGWWPSVLAAARLASMLPPESTVALSEAGLVGAVAPQVRLIDVVGLHDRRFAHRGFSAEELFRRRPDLIWMPNPDYRSIFESILQSPRLADAYDVYPGLLDYGVALRRDSPHRAEILAALESIFARFYADSAPLSAYRAQRLESPPAEAAA